MTKSILAWARTFPPSESEGWTIHFIERNSRYWVAAKAGKKTNALFEQGTAKAWQWANSARFIRWFTDGERRYGKTLWRLASLYLKAKEVHPAYGHRKVWREGLEVAIKIKGSQGNRRVEWVKTEHPFTFISPKHEIHANHNVGVSLPAGWRRMQRSGDERAPTDDGKTCMPNALKHYSGFWMYSV